MNWPVFVANLVKFSLSATNKPVFVANLVKFSRSATKSAKIVDGVGEAGAKPERCKVMPKYRLQNYHNIYRNRNLICGIRVNLCIFARFYGYVNTKI